MLSRGPCSGKYQASVYYMNSFIRPGVPAVITAPQPTTNLVAWTATFVLHSRILWVKTQWAWLSFAPQVLGPSARKTHARSNSGGQGCVTPRLLRSRAGLGQAGSRAGLTGTIGQSPHLPWSRPWLCPSWKLGSERECPKGMWREPAGSWWPAVTEPQTSQGVTPTTFCWVTMSPAGWGSRGGDVDPTSPWNLMWQESLTSAVSCGSPTCIAWVGRTEAPASSRGAEASAWRWFTLLGGPDRQEPQDQCRFL